jgi:histidine triad (HIT) family protein
MEDCIFCKVVAGELPSTRIDEDERCVAFMDIAPGSRGHALVIPRAHAKDLAEIDPDDLAAVARMGQRIAKRALDGPLGATGVNLVNSCGPDAWQTVFHFHLHVIPRYPDDPLRLPWTPGQGATDPDDIATAAEALRA